MTHPFDQHYFNGGGKVGGYAHEGYRDFNCHQITFDKVMALKPESVLELGAGRGYVLKRLEDAGVRVNGLEISEHCYLTRAIENIVTWDITVAPWPVKDGEFDACISVAVLEHIPEDKLAVIFSEMARTCKRGLHGIDLHDEDGFDKTHVEIHDLPWWTSRLPPGHIGVDKEDLEKGELHLPKSEGVKLNLGCSTAMFHGWRNFDILDLRDWASQQRYSFVQWDILKGIPFDDDIVDAIFVSHVLDYFTYEDGLRFLTECHRVLKPGGVLRVLVPDAGKLIKNYETGVVNKFDELSAAVSARETQVSKLHELLVGGRHSIYDSWTLLKAFVTAGFKNAEQMRFRSSKSYIVQKETIDLYPELSLIVEAVV